MIVGESTSAGRPVATRATADAGPGSAGVRPVLDGHGGHLGPVRRQGQGERRALAHRAVDGQVAAHGPCEPAGEREPEPDALLPQVAWVELLEQLEDALARVRGDAWPRVVDADADGVVA